MATTEERNQQVLAVLNAASEPIGPTEIAYRVRRDWAYNSAPIVPVLRRIGAGFAGIFNAIADINDNVYCMMETAEDSVSIMSDLALWKPFERPPAPPTLNAGKEAGNADQA